MGLRIAGNIVAGHVILGILEVSFIGLGEISQNLSGSISFAGFIGVEVALVILTNLELAVAVIQGYVLTLLTSTFLKEVEELRVTAKREKAEAELAVMHPDFNTIREDDTFHEWAKEQPKWVQDALYENVDDAKSVSRVIDLYKADKGITAKKKTTEDKGAASSVTTKRTTTPSDSEESTYIRESQVAKMSIKEYEKRAEEIMEAQRSGKFIYDMSRK